MGNAIAFDPAINSELGSLVENCLVRKKENTELLEEIKSHIAYLYQERSENHTSESMRLMIEELIVATKITCQLLEQEREMELNFRDNVRSRLMSYGISYQFPIFMNCDN